MMCVTAILLASLNFSLNLYYYRAAGLVAILVGVLGNLAIREHSRRIAAISGSKQGNGDYLANLHVAAPTILIVGGLIVSLATSW